MYVLKYWNMSDFPLLTLEPAIGIHCINPYTQTHFAPRLLMMNVVTQNGTRSGLKERTINILCSSLHELSHSPGRGVFSGSPDVNHRCQSRGYWSNELAISMKLASLYMEKERERKREREREMMHSFHEIFNHLLIQFGDIIP